MQLESFSKSLIRVKWSLPLLLLWSISSCYKALPTEEPILSEEKMRLVLKDIHVAEALLTETTDRRVKDSLARIYYGQIFRLHEVDPIDFDKSVHAYFTNPPALDSLYEHIILDLAAEKQTFLKGKGPKPDPNSHHIRD